MNKTAIKTFAIWARNKLIEDVRYKARLIGITEKDIDEPLPNSLKDLLFFDIGNDNEPYAIAGEAIKQREKLIAALRKREKLSDYKTAFDSLVEETAYTWFNRLIAIRFMEVNQYLPSNLRVLSSGGEKKEPELVSKPFDSGFKFSDAEISKITKWKEENNAAELFIFLFIKQCNELNAVLPELFEKINDYTELLINLNYTDPAGVVRKLITDIPEDDFKEAVEIIGWLYQYYNTEPKAEVDAYVKTGKKVTKKDIPAKTQLFTPDWIVRYMVENSLGRLWIEGHPNEELKKNWKYYLDEAEQEEDVKKQLEEIRQEYKTIKPGDIKVIDPCMGSGHILVYLFTLLMQIYESQGYNPRDAAKLILEKNLYGLDIDDRAWQLAYFAVLMKARQYNRTILTESIKPHLYAIQESNGIDAKYLQYFGEGMDDKERSLAFSDIKTLVAIFDNGKEYGSILKIPNLNFKLMHTFIEKVDKKGFLPASTELFPEAEQQPDLMPIETIVVDDIQAKLNELINIAEILHDKYHVVVTNPPYMGSGDMNSHLSNFVKREYENSKSDLFAVFIERGFSLIKQNGYNCMVTMQGWMFLSSYETMRKNILTNKTIINLMHMENMVMGIAFGTAVTNLHGQYIEGYKGRYNHIELSLLNNNVPRIFPPVGKRNVAVSADNLAKIPSSPVAYWVSETILRLFSNKKIKDFGFAGIGMRTGDNERFLRYWFEISSINFHKKWIPYNKGGEFRRWYGNNDFVVNWENDGFEIKENTRHVYPQLGDNLGWKISNEKYYFKPGITWTGVTMAKFSCRCYEEGFIFDSGANGLFAYDSINHYYLAGWLNTKIVNSLIMIMNPTINNGAGLINGIPISINEQYHSVITEKVVQCISLSRTDWDSFETSWDFKRHPLIPNADLRALRTKGSTPLRENSSNDIPSYKVSESYNQWQKACEERFQTLKSNEEELNRIFIEIYGLQDELTPEVEDKDVTVRRADLGREIRSLISYAVGCMFGRYSLDVEGLAYAGGDWDNSKYKTFIPNKSNIIPITDEDYFNDDITNLFIGFIRTVYGEETLEENLNFIANALNSRGGNSRDTIRGYFLNDFYKDHVKIYQKRPIYWLFDSGKENSFKALIYMHRYHADTIGNLRIDHLHKTQNTYENEIARMQRIIKTTSSASERAKSQKKLEKLQRQLREIKAYDEKIAHLALCKTEIDLDDGVKHNYEKIQTAQGGIKHEILGKIG
ncbi:restriction endonuclease [Treponema sp. R8-4-B8]